MVNKVRYKCVNCGTLSSSRHPAHFTQDENTYRCKKCAIRKNSTVKEIRICVDCGKSSSLKSVNKFSQPKENYRCPKCANIKRTHTPSWIEKNKTHLKKLNNDPKQKEWRILKNKEMSKDPVWLEKMKQNGIHNSENQTWKHNLSVSISNKFATDNEYKQKVSDSAKIRFEKHPDLRKRLSMAKQGITDEAEWPGFVNVGDYCDKWTDPKYKVRKRVRARFNDRCIICGKTREQNGGKRMGVHHVYRKKDACCAGDKVDWLFATLCLTCHGVYGHNADGVLKIREILAIEYGNKCMLSLEDYNTLYPNGSTGDKRWGSANGR